VIDLRPADLADADSLRVAVERLPGVIATTGAGDWYFFYDPDGVTVPERRFPFCTIVTGDRYDGASRLDRDEATYRLNLGISRDSYEAHFGPAPRQAAGREVIDTGADYTATDTLLPHPYYAPLHWVCVVNPGEGTRAELSRLLGESLDDARRAYEKQRQRRDPP
jgi:hypothetical protein